MVAKMFEYEDADRRRQIGIVAIGVDLLDQRRQVRFLPFGDFAQTIPEFIFKRDTGFMPAQDDRAFNDRRFHARTELGYNGKAAFN